jgi:hypothetical protein
MRGDEVLTEAVSRQRKNNNAPTGFVTRLRGIVALNNNNCWKENMYRQKPDAKSWYFIGCKPSASNCEHCGKSAADHIIHTLELHKSGQKQRTQACLQCAEKLVRKADKGLPTWAHSQSICGGMGFEGWTSRWHWEDCNGMWEAR